ncbi:hypothetical protein ICN30_10040 [Polynucleobacter sp. 31A-FELB]|jgi:hypothetical protein|uniref:hypothetical protein n=1 Tax=Polynucleobacter sp. 31A-FELB TaxID=2689096 RepID=UPI001C0D8129|nr:hypothetical protein [Polynucleobacter sp. 31A-FELB]MBU3588176.1 hypothetical protein [Polynucleobacter sp. 31A-FELB]
MADKTKVSSDRQLALLASRAKALNGLTTLEYSRKRAFTVCYWVLRWGVSTPALIDKVSGATRLGVCQKLVDKGLLKKTKTASGGYVHGTARYIISLTKQGLDFLRQYGLDETVNYRLVDPNKIRQDKLRHDFISQSITYDNLTDGNILDFVPEYLNTEPHKANEKIVDCLWLHHDNSKTGLEIELSPRFSRMLNQFIYNVSVALIDKKVDRFLLLTDRQSICDRYTVAMNSGSVPLWFKNNQGRWTLKTESFPIPKHLQEKFICVYKSKL